MLRPLFFFIYRVSCPLSVFDYVPFLFFVHFSPFLPVPPKVSVFQKDSSSSTVVCHANGFYPEAVMVTWKRDGMEMTGDIEVGETMPNADGNFQNRAVLTVPLKAGKNSKYTCEVTHSEIIFVLWHRSKMS